MKRVLIFFLLSTFILSSCGSSNNSSASNSPANYIQNKGSDTIVNLALAWAEKYQSDRPEVRISVTGGGSGTGIAALVKGAIDIANASRNMKPEEIEAYTALSEPYDKAGAYAIQEWIGVVGIKNINGDFYNVMGLPVSRVVKAIDNLSMDNG